MPFIRPGEYHWFPVTCIMAAAAVIFGLTSINLFFFFKANLTLIAQHGIAALMEGALEELFSLLFNGAIALTAYIVFKACEKTLVERFFK